MSENMGSSSDAPPEEERLHEQGAGSRLQGLQRGVWQGIQEAKCSGTACVRKLVELVQGRAAVLPDEPLWMLGTCYGVTDQEGQREMLPPEILEAFGRDFASRVWCTYRKNFPSLGESLLTSDVGWGCTLRSGQMLVAEALSRHVLGRCWMRDPSQADPRMLSLLSQLSDSPSAPLSIHQLCAAGANHGIQPGKWLGPWVLCKALGALFSRAQPWGLSVHVVCDPSGGGAPALDMRHVRSLLPQPSPPPPPPPPQADVASTGGMPSWIVAPPRVHAAACASPQYPASPDGVGTTTSTSVHGASSNQAPPHSPPASSHGCLPQPPASQPPTTTLAPESAFPQASNALPVSNGAAQHMQSTPAPLPHHQSPAQYTPNQPLEAQRSHAGGHLPLGGIGSSQPHPAGSSFSELNKMAAVTTAAPSAALMHQQQVQMHPQPPVLPPPAVQQLPVQHPPAQSHPPPMVGALPAQGQHQNQAPPMNTNDDDQDSVLLLVPDGPKGDQQDEQGHQKLQQQVAGSAQQPLTEEEDGNLAEWGWG
mmetsp:Transcript_3863/g.10500  ORF Transcript_3863/g.10500 Transcript_3863/m.10500 type:complete len:535 (+) Transcript_3863:142-1746(+)